MVFVTNNLLFCPRRSRRPSKRFFLFCTHCKGGVCIPPFLFPDIITRTFQEQPTFDEWTSCWRFAKKWQFTVQQELARKTLEISASSADKIGLGRMHEEFRGWLEHAFTTMVKRYEPPTLREGRRLGVDDLVLIGLLRHHRLCSKTVQLTELVNSALAAPHKFMQEH